MYIFQLYFRCLVPLSLSLFLSFSLFFVNFYIFVFLIFFLYRLLTCNYYCQVIRLDNSIIQFAFLLILFFSFMFCFILLSFSFFLDPFVRWIACTFWIGLRLCLNGVGNTSTGIIQWRVVLTVK